MSVGSVSEAQEEGGQASEVERLQRQLAAVMESRAAEINDDNIRLVNHLSEVRVMPPMTELSRLCHHMG